MATPTAPTAGSFTATDAVKWILILWGIACLAVVAYFVFIKGILSPTEDEGPTLAAVPDLEEDEDSE